MKTISVVIPTLRKVHAFIAISQLRHLPWPMKLHLVPEGKTWSEAVNLGLAEVGDNDVVLMDDDVFIEPTTFDLVDQYYDEADLFGFKLRHADGTIQHAGGIWQDNEIMHRGWGKQDTGQYERPLYCCHVTTSLIYIKNSVLKTIGGMAHDYPGMQFEDVDFNFRALKAGLRILYLPGPATHLESASKKSFTDFNEKMALSKAELYRRHIDGHPDFVKEISKLPQPAKGLVLA